MGFSPAGTARDPAPGRRDPRGRQCGGRLTRPLPLAGKRPRSGLTADRCGCGLKFRLPGDRTDQVVLRLLRYVRRIGGLRVPEHRLAGRTFPPEAAVTTG